jgi:hypothetical protein
VRISKEKIASPSIGIMQPLIQPSAAARKKELLCVIQSALRVGADLSAREAGRKAFSEYVKLDTGSDGATAPAPEQILFTREKRRKDRAFQ